MHRHSISQDSARNIRTNPLNIVMTDGSDLVLPRKHLYETFASYWTKDDNEDKSVVGNCDTNNNDFPDKDSSFTFDSSFAKRPRPLSSICVSKSVNASLSTSHVPAPEKAEFVSTNTPQVPTRSVLRPRSEILDPAEASTLLSKFSEFSKETQHSNLQENLKLDIHENTHTNNNMEKKLLAAEARMLESHDSLNGSREVSPETPRDLSAEIASLSISNGSCKLLPKVSSSSLETLQLRDTSVNPFSDLSKRVYQLKPTERTLDPLSPTKAAFFEDDDTSEVDSVASPTSEGLLSLSIDSNPLDFSGLGLCRKNTITSSGEKLSSCRPSESSEAFKKLKTARTKFGSLKRTELDKQRKLLEQEEREWLEGDLEQELNEEHKDEHKEENDKHKEENDEHKEENDEHKEENDEPNESLQEPQELVEEPLQVKIEAPQSVFESDSCDSSITVNSSQFDSANEGSPTPGVYLSTSEAITESFYSVVTTLDPNAKEDMPSPMSPQSPTSPAEGTFDFHIMQQLTQMPTPDFNRMMETPKLGRAASSIKAPVEKVIPEMVEVSETPVSETPNVRPSSSTSSTNSTGSVLSAQSPASTAVSSSGGSLKNVTPQIDKHDRGRLFMAIRGLKDIRLPIDHTRHPKYTLTLDNGIQCVTTEPMELRSSSKIDQEFELLVGEDLELVFTLKASMDPLVAEKPVKEETTKSTKPASQTPPTSPKKLSKGKSFKALFSPRKRKQQTREVVEEKQTPVPAKKSTTPTPDLWDHIVSSSGSFARCYIVESQYEQEIFGRSRTYSIPLYNEWGQEKTVSRQSKKAVWKAQEPYRIGYVEVTLMYIPRVSRYDRLPTSMQTAQKELEEAKKCQEMHMEGYLSQEGGDCAYWRRRWFVLDGHVLRGFHEDTRKERCVFDLSHVTDIVELGNPKTRSSKSSRHAHSGLVGGYALVEGAFRVMFGDDTFVNFYAENDLERARWISVLSVAMQNVPGKNVTWTDLVFQQHKADAENSAKIRQGWDGLEPRTGFVEGST